MKHGLIYKSFYKNIFCLEHFSNKKCLQNAKFQLFWLQQQQYVKISCSLFLGHTPSIIISIDSHVKWLEFTKIIFFHLAYLTTYVCHELYKKILITIQKIVTIFIGQLINIFDGHGHLRQPPSDWSIIGGVCPYKIKNCINPEFYVHQLSIPMI